MTDIYFSQFWKVEVWDQGAGMVKLWWQTADLLYPHMAGSKERKQMVSYYKGTNPLHEGSTFMTSLNPSYSPKAPAPKTLLLSTVEFQHLNFGEETQTFIP